MSILVDTNVLLRRIQPNHEHQAAAIKAIRQFIQAGEPAHFALQNISEFWNVATRPTTNNGLGFSISDVLREVEKIEGFLTLLPDTAATYAEWKRLVVQHSVTGAKVHDARLAAIMKVHEIERILTFNVDDFTRYGFEVLNPISI